MNNTLATCAALLLSWFLLAVCSTSIRYAQATQQAQLGEPFALRTGQTAYLNDTSLQIVFASIPAAGRCPTNIDCAETAPVHVLLKVSDTGENNWQEVRLQVHTTQDGAVIPTAPGTVISERFGGYEIALVSVTPYLDAEQSTDERDYRIELIVSGEAP
jgi:hypothetical protein